MKVYENIRSYIDEIGLKQVVVAEKAGIQKTTFNAILNGKRALYADELRSICIALNVRPEIFLEFDNIVEQIEDTTQ